MSFRDRALEKRMEGEFERTMQEAKSIAERADAGYNQSIEPTDDLDQHTLNGMVLLHLLRLTAEMPGLNVIISDGWIMIVSLDENDMPKCRR